MGNRCSRTYDSDNPVNDLDAKLGQAIADARALAGKTEAKRHTMDELMLKFPTLRNGFRKCRELFAAFDQNNDDLVSFSEFQAGCLEIGLDSESVRHLFQAADIDHSHKIDPSGASRHRNDSTTLPAARVRPCRKFRACTPLLLACDQQDRAFSKAPPSKRTFTFQAFGLVAGLDGLAWATTCNRLP